MKTQKVAVIEKDNFEALHKQGAERYGGAWLCANMATAEHARSRTDVSNKAMKGLLTLVTLRVLMALEVNGWLKPSAIISTERPRGMNQGEQ